MPATCYEVGECMKGPGFFTVSFDTEGIGHMNPILVISGIMFQERGGQFSTVCHQGHAFSS